MSPFGRRFGRQPTPIQVRWQDGEPIEFERRPMRKGARYLVTDVRERWIEESPWPFPSPMPVGGDRLRCWRVLLPGSSHQLRRHRPHLAAAPEAAQQGTRFCPRCSMLTDARSEPMLQACWRCTLPMAARNAACPAVQS